MFESLDAALYRRGFVNADVRSLVRAHLLLTGCCLLLALPLVEASDWAWSFAAGAVIIAFNFWHMAKSGQHMARMGKREALVSALFRFYARLALTGLALYLLIVHAGASPFGLLVGLSLIVVTFLGWGISRFTGLRAHVAPKGKEA